MTRGGYRKNAKRPLKYGEPTVRITVQIPETKAKEIKAKIARILKPYEKPIVKKLDK
jgi:hypothetical protein